MSGKRVLNEYESKRLLERYGIKTVEDFMTIRGRNDP